MQYSFGSGSLNQLTAHLTRCGLIFIDDNQTTSKIIQNKTEWQSQDCYSHHNKLNCAQTVRIRFSSHLHWNIRALKGGDFFWVFLLGLFFRGVEGGVGFLLVLGVFLVLFFLREIADNEFSPNFLYRYNTFFGSR